MMITNRIYGLTKSNLWANKSFHPSSLSARLHIQLANLNFLGNHALLQTVVDPRYRRAASARLDAFGLENSLHSGRTRVTAVRLTGCVP